MIPFILSSLYIIPQVLGCATHDTHAGPLTAKRQLSVSNGDRIPTYWQYEASYNWGKLTPDYEVCQTGTRQSPIPLSLKQGLSEAHIPQFSAYNLVNASGEYYNWGYGPAFSLYHPEGDYSSLPSMEVDGDIHYLAGWHIHAPAEHLIDGHRSKAELHYVHHDANGTESAVVAIRLDPHQEDSKWFAELPHPAIHFNDTSVYENVEIDLLQPILEVDNFSEFWSYKGSLTSPPCTEGIRWFVARNILQMSDEQMQELLRVSTYSARVEQKLWEHEVNL